MRSPGIPEEPARTRVSGAMTMRLASSIFPRETGEKSDGADETSEILTVMVFFLQYGGKRDEGLRRRGSTLSRRRRGCGPRAGAGPLTGTRFQARGRGVGGECGGERGG